MTSAVANGLAEQPPMDVLDVRSRFLPLDPARDTLRGVAGRR